MPGLRSDLLRLADPARARVSQRFFKTGPGQYGEGDRFLGIAVPGLRKAILPYRTLPLRDVILLLQDPWHECRLAALLLLVERYRKGSAKEREEVAKLYRTYRRFVNNWDLVDSSAWQILGEHARARGIAVLEPYAACDLLWENRMAMVATFAFTRSGDPRPAWAFARRFLRHEHDLMHKACGWMLREAGKVHPAGLRAFLKEHASHMPRTMLRYAIERLPNVERRTYLAMRAVPMA